MPAGPHRQGPGCSRGFRGHSGRRPRTTPGSVDILACTSQGHACYICLGHSYWEQGRPNGAATFSIVPLVMICSACRPIRGGAYTWHPSVEGFITVKGFSSSECNESIAGRAVEMFRPRSAMCLGVLVRKYPQPPILAIHVVRSSRHGDCLGL